MVMRRLIFAAALMTSGIVVAADSSTFELRDAEDLVRACSVPQKHTLYRNAIGFCHGVLTGAYRYYQATVTAENRFVCTPNPVPTRAKVMDDFVAWSKTHPQYLKEPPIDTLFRYLEETFPCGK
jgi:Rap1a immunity proteins